MSGEVIAALLALLGTAFGSLAGILTSSRLTNYRIEQLEKKVEKHNAVMERTALLERDLKTAFRLIDEIKERGEVVEWRQ